MVREMLLNTWATFVYFFSQWLLTIIITRFSGYEDSGIFTLAVSFANIFGYIGKFGVRSAQVGDVSYRYSDAQYFTARVLTSAASLVPFVIALLFCGYHPELRACCIAMMCYKLLEGFDDMIIGSLQRRHRYEWIAVSYTLKAVLTLAAFTGLILAGVPLVLCICAMALAYLLVILFYDAVRVKKLDFFHWSVKELKTLLWQCLPLMAMTILDALLVYLPRNSVEQIYGSEELGYYGSVSIVVVVLSTLAGAVWGSVLTRYSEIIHSRNWKAFRNLTITIALVLAVFSAAVFVVGYLIGPFFFEILYGEGILSHMDLLVPVLLNALLLLINSFFVCIFVPFGRRGVLMATDAAAVAVCILCTTGLTEQWGSVGASISLMIALAVRFILLVVAAVLCTNQAKRACQN